MQTFFTSDTHFDDEFAIQYFNRPFQSVDEMNAVMVERWNKAVTDDDLVYHLGDFTPGELSHFIKWADQLKGTIKFCQVTWIGSGSRILWPARKFKYLRRSFL